ncbi:5572_t:CDS:1, partial [Gigaspora margarita]
KKQRRIRAIDYLLAMKDPHIMKYPQSDLVAILKNNGYHSE